MLQASEYLLLAKQAGFVLKSKIFGQKPTNTLTQRKPLYFVNPSSDDSLKIGHDFRKVVQTLKLSKNNYNKKYDS